MYPSSLSTNLRRCYGAYVQTSLSRTFVHKGQTGLSLVARSTFSSKNFSSCLSFRAERGICSFVASANCRSLAPLGMTNVEIDLGSGTFCFIMSQPGLYLRWLERTPDKGEVGSS